LSETSLSERRFTDEAVRKILKKAVERTSSRALATREGLWLDDLHSLRVLPVADSEG
jgi:hypothetical protein